MSVEGFQIMDYETIEILIVKREYIRIYHQQIAQFFNYCDQKIEFNFKENNKYHQIGTAHLQYDVTVTRVAAIPIDRTLTDTDNIRLFKNSFADTFKEANHPTTKGSELEINKLTEI